VSEVHSHKVFLLISGIPVYHDKSVSIRQNIEEFKKGMLEPPEGPLLMPYWTSARKDRASWSRKSAKNWTNLKKIKKDEKWILIDGSPGIGCVAIASIAGADAVVAVAEPTKSVTLPATSVR